MHHTPSVCLSKHESNCLHPSRTWWAAAHHLSTRVLCKTTTSTLYFFFLVFTLAIFLLTLLSSFHHLWDSRHCTQNDLSFFVILTSPLFWPHIPNEYLVALSPMLLMVLSILCTHQLTCSLTVTFIHPRKVNTQLISLDSTIWRSNKWCWPCLPYTPQVGESVWSWWTWSCWFWASWYLPCS